MITRLFFYIDFFANKYIVKKKHVAIVRNFIVTKVLCIPTKTQFLVWFVTVTVLSIATYQVHVKYQYYVVVNIYLYGDTNALRQLCVCYCRLSYYCFIFSANLYICNLVAINVRQYRIPTQEFVDRGYNTVIRWVSINSFLQFNRL